ncbi:hypothetical protein [Mesonia aestuariivivens]|uniref:SGNH hydrolase-type esterase domain-containing protein n=1 Tax=Mesonia aestuariivivens TaxID=2796128 RepID=A0ABS6W0Z0_9FLAO|nr:hypothetical protein [Mesonia aestuariivivens]MBW2961521.1 hypothetical protein [Mesonia aestuariivivens]
MRPLPKKFIWLTFFALIIYLTVDFLEKRKENFWQFNYDFDAIKIEQKLGEVKIDSLSTDYLALYTSKDITSIDDNSLQLVQNKKAYYFNYENAYIENGLIKFTGGFWILNQPKPSHKFTANIIDLPLIQSGNIKINIITDSQLLWQGGRSFRKWLKEKNNDLYFVGEQTDLYGYPYNGGILANSKKILKKTDQIPKADVYLVSLGTHEKLLNIKDKTFGFQSLVNDLKYKNPQAKIFIINLPPSTDQERNIANKRFNKELSSLVNGQAYIIDFYGIMLKNNFKSLIGSDKIHYKTKAYKILINYINDKINEDY